MTLSVDTTTSPVHLTKESPLSMTTSIASPLISPCSEKRFWSALKDRVETLLESRQPTSGVESNRVNRMKEDSALLMRGFDSVASCLSQLTNNLDTALQGARELAKPTPVAEMVHNNTDAQIVGDKQIEQSEMAEGNGDTRRLKRKLDSRCSHFNDQKLETGYYSDRYEEGADDSKKENQQQHQAEKNLKKAKSLAVSMAAKSTSLAKELRSVKSDMCFLQERCALLEEENRRLRDGFGKGIRPDEDDLVRLQLEALLAEKSRLATENTNLTRENQCLRQLVEYHQFASQDLSASYEQVIEGLYLDFSSPIAEGGNNARVDDLEDPQTPTAVEDFEFHKSLVGDLELLKD